MNVISLFDGMSCGQIALHELGFDFRYFASEIKPHAIMTTKVNFPETTHLGDVRRVSIGGGKFKVTTVFFKLVTLICFLAVRLAKTFQG